MHLPTHPKLSTFHRRCSENASPRRLRMPCARASIALVDATLLPAAAAENVPNVAFASPQFACDAEIQQVELLHNDSLALAICATLVQRLAHLGKQAMAIRSPYGSLEQRARKGVLAAVRWLHDGEPIPGLAQSEDPEALNPVEDVPAAVVHLLGETVHAGDGGSSSVGR